MENKIKICFLGNAPISLSALKSLFSNKTIEIVLIVTNSDKAIGRSQSNLQENLVAKFAAKNNISILKTDNINSQVQFINANYSFDYLITCAFSQILSKEILSLAKKYSLNIHSSILPKGRGGAPIHGAILNGEKETGLTIMEMNEKMDEGDYFIIHSFAINQNETYDSLYTKFESLIEKTFVNDLLAIEQGLKKQPQDYTKVTYWYNIKTQEEKLDFDQEAIKIEQKIRAFNSIPGSFAIINDQRIKIFEAKILKTRTDKKPGTILKISKDGVEVATSTTNLLIDNIIIPGKKQNLLKSLVHGKLPFKEGEIFS